MSTLKDKVVAITGAASGIGRAVAHESALHGASLALADIQGPALKQVAQDLRSQGAQVTATVVDVVDSDCVDDWIRSTVDTYGRLDGAVNMAGIEGDDKIFRNFTDTENSTWDKIIQVNLTGMFYCLRAQLRVMKQGAAIVNAASTAALSGRAGVMAYSVSKHGVLGLTRCAARESGSRGIRVNAVAPGPVQTPLMDRILQEAGKKDIPAMEMHRSLAIPRLGTPEELAKTFVFLLSDDSSWTTGSVYTVDGGAMC
ncbi:hypothetical protein H2204_006624 [Knufia peltigerae]|uniref:Uncharacterized protein n=1 Tax=Knufia peltigerae TaxID=1002370 RepID=A0AA38Y4F0_9EURO|nr:hypothetical protein H2204_006624 [Knufia peltigerae]